MKTYTVEDINKLGPCYPPTRHLDVDKKYTLIDLLEHPTAPDSSKVWVVTCLMSDTQNREFSLWVAETVLKEFKVYNPLLITVISVLKETPSSECLKKLKGAAYNVWLNASEGSVWKAAMACMNAADECASEGARLSAYHDVVKDTKISKLKEIILKGNN